MHMLRRSIGGLDCCRFGVPVISYLSDTLARVRTVTNSNGASSQTVRLLPLDGFGSNPGALKGWSYVPPSDALKGLVVVLHGCTQTAAGYDHGSGWSELAERHGFAVLFPEQQRANNANSCFNWFVADDIRRGSGEALSIRQMIAAIIDRHVIDPARIYITGLSAGGAMTAAMLATYPEVFVGGAIIAGLPYGSAASVPQALERMRGHGYASPEISAELVRRASSHQGPWPTLSVWHGTVDRTVAVVNADLIVEQWRLLKEIRAEPDRTEVVDGHQHRVWFDNDGGVAIEEYRIAGMGHGTPLRTQGDRSCGNAGAFMLDCGVSSTWHIANSWGLIKAAMATGTVAEHPSAAEHGDKKPRETTSVQATIEKALRAAGLMG